MLDSIRCYRCGNIHGVTHEIEKSSEDLFRDSPPQSVDRVLSFYRCNGGKYLIAINGRDIRQK